MDRDQQVVAFFTENIVAFADAKQCILHDVANQEDTFFGVTCSKQGMLGMPGVRKSGVGGLFHKTSVLFFRVIQTFSMDASFDMGDRD